jgi:hypothetical protein
VKLKVYKYSGWRHGCGFVVHAVPEWDARVEDSFRAVCGVKYGAWNGFDDNGKTVDIDTKTPHIHAINGRESPPFSVCTQCLKKVAAFEANQKRLALRKLVVNRSTKKWKNAAARLRKIIPTLHADTLKRLIALAKDEV